MLRLLDPAAAAEAWTALVAGRWSILETAARDGRRYLVARRNRVRPDDLVQLDPCESDVLWLAAQGHSHEHIAYELGISSASVARRLTSGMHKLRIRTRRELLRKLGVARLHAQG